MSGIITVGAGLDNQRGTQDIMQRSHQVHGQGPEEVRWKKSQQKSKFLNKQSNLCKIFRY